MKKLFILGLFAFFATNLSAQKVEDTKTYKINGDLITVMASQYDVMFGAGATSSEPLTIVVLKDKYGAKLGQMNFFPAGHKSIAKESTKSDRVGFDLNYSMEVFEGITDMMEGENVELEFNTKTKRASVNFKGAKSGGSSATRAAGVTRGNASDVSKTDKIKLQNTKLQPGTLKKVK